MRALIVLLLVAPLAAAGTPDDPEVTDDAGDHFTGVAQDPFTAWDINMVYFSAEGCDAGHDWVWLGLENILEDNQGNPGAVVTGTVFFQVAGAPFRVVARGIANQDGQAEPVYTLYGVGLTKAVAGGHHNDNAAPEGIHWCIPHADVGAAGDAVTGIWGQTMLEDVDEADRQELDRAPDDAPATTGRAWVLGGAPEALPVLNVTASETSVGVQDGTASFLLLLRNDGNADGSVSIVVAPAPEWDVAAEPANLTVPAGAGAQAWINATWQGAGAAPDADFVVTISHGGGNETLVLAAQGQDAAGPSGGPNATAGPDANTTTAPSDKKGIPAPLVLLAPAIAAAAARRRR